MDREEKTRDPHLKSPMMLVNDIGKAFHDRMRRAMDNAGVPSGYRHLLFHLARQNGCTQLELARVCHLSPPTVSVTLQKMMRDGYIERQVDDNDQRQVRVFLTERGMSVEKSNGAYAEQTDKLSMEGFSEEEKQTLTELLLGCMQIFTGTSKPHLCVKERTDRI